MTTLVYRPLSHRRTRFNEEVHIPLNVSASDDEFVISAFVPGIRADELEIEVLADRILIEGEFLAPAEEEGLRLLRQEMPVGRFQRSIRLRSQLDASKAVAEVKDGLLTLTVPKAEHAKSRKIAVKAS